MLRNILVDWHCRLYRYCSNPPSCCQFLLDGCPIVSMMNIPILLDVMLLLPNTMDKLIHVVSKAFEIPPEAVVPDLSPKNTPSWDSLVELILFSDIEVAFNIKFGNNETMTIHTLADLVKLMRSKGVDLQ